MNAPFDVTGVTIRTERLLLREWRESDLADFFAYASVPGVGECAGWAHHESVAQSQEILDMFIREKKTFAIVLSDGKVIGSLGVEYLDKALAAVTQKGRELGYVLSRDYWGRGLMTEAVRAVIAYLFDTLDYDFVTCGHFLSNDRSRRVIEKCGFERLSVKSDYVTRMGDTQTVIYYLLRNPNR